MFFRAVTCIAIFAGVLPFHAIAQTEPQSYIVEVKYTSFAAESDQPVQPDERSKSQPTIWENHNPKMHRFLQRLEAKHGFKATNLYSHALTGFAAVLNDKQLSALRDLPGVRIEKNYRMELQNWPYSDQYIGSQWMSWGMYAVNADKSSAKSGSNTQALQFNRTRIYVIDSGVALNPDLNVEERVSVSTNIDPNPCTAHGTAVAGVAGAKNNSSGVAGVAPGVPIVSIRVTYDCTGNLDLSSVAQAVDWVVNKELYYYDTVPGYAGGVINMSDSGPRQTDSSSLAAALARAATPTTMFRQIAWGPAVFKPVAFGGIFTAVAAGNDVGDACGASPGYVGPSTGGVVNVGAVTEYGTMAAFSAYGSCVELWAPGQRIVTTYLGNNSVFSIDGTSIAAPFVAGIAALIRQTKGYLTPAQVENIMKMPENTKWTGFYDSTMQKLIVPQANNY